MYLKFTHCHSQELKLHFSVLSGSMQISSASKKRLLRFSYISKGARKGLLSCLEEELLSQEALRALRTQMTALPTTPSFTLDRLFASTSFFNEKPGLFYFASGLFFAGLSQAGEAGRGRGRQVRMISESALLSWTA